MRRLKIHPVRTSGCPRNGPVRGRAWRFLAVFPAIALLLPAAGTAMQPEHAAPTELDLTEQPERLGEIGRMIARATEGDTIEIAPGTYHEQIVVDRSITLIGRGKVIIDGGGSGTDIVRITAPDVTVRGFTIRNTGIDLDKENAGIRALAPRATIEDNILQDILFGIDLRMAHDSIIRNNVVGGKDLDIARRGDGVRLWRSDNTLIEGNIIHDGRDAILWYSEGVIIRGNRAVNCRYGFHLMFSHNVTLEDNELKRNSVGAYLMYSTGVEMYRNRLVLNRGPSGYGIGFKEVDQFTVADNLIIGNRVGIYMDGSPFTDARPGEFYRNTIAHNDIGMTFLPSVRGNLFWDNNFIDNIEQISMAGRGDLRHNQFWTEGQDTYADVPEHAQRANADGSSPVYALGRPRGNFWSDYTGYDHDRDGIGDWIHESYTLFENLLDQEPKLRILLFSPAQQAIEFVGRAVPAIRPEPKFTDELPLMRPVAIEIGDIGPAPRRASLAMVGALLLAVGGGLLVAAKPRLRSSAPRRSANSTTPNTGGHAS